jgi:hypothetical protein
MIATLEIERFKSIRSLGLACRKINIFIGPPDTGKTNILESLFLVSCLGWNRAIGPALRLRPPIGFDPLFYRQFFDAPLTITLSLAPRRGDINADVLKIAATISGGGEDRVLELSVPALGHAPVRVGFTGRMRAAELNWVRCYQYTSSERWEYRADLPLGDKVIAPPEGENLLYIARHDSRVYEFLKDMVLRRHPAS